MGRAVALEALAPHLPAALLAEALTSACSITDEKMRVQVLQMLAPKLPAALLVEALSAARAITDEQVRARALRALAPQLARTSSMSHPEF